MIYIEWKENMPFGIKTPDYIINDEKFDLKEITVGVKYTQYKEI